MEDFACVHTQLCAHMLMCCVHICECDQACCVSVCECDEGAYL